MATVRLQSEQLSFHQAKSGPVHVHDTDDPFRTGQTICGRTLAGLLPLSQRGVYDMTLCKRCYASLISERKWGGLGIQTKHSNRWAAFASDAAL